MSDGTTSKKVINETDFLERIPHALNVLFTVDDLTNVAHHLLQHRHVARLHLSTNSIPDLLPGKSTKIPMNTQTSGDPP